jgi:hypothetical protein
MSSVGLVSDRIGARGGYCGRIDRARVLYYFPTKEQLLMATLERRFELRRSRAEAIGRDSGVVAMMRFHLEAGLAKPGMMRLFITLAAEATDPDHQRITTSWTATKEPMINCALASQPTSKLAGQRGPSIRLRPQSGSSRSAMDCKCSTCSGMGLADGLQPQHR